MTLSPPLFCYHDHRHHLRRQLSLHHNSSPKPGPIPLATTHVAGTEIVLYVGGSQAIASMAYGVNAKLDENGMEMIPEVPPCNVIIGPGKN